MEGVNGFLISKVIKPRQKRRKKSSKKKSRKVIFRVKTNVHKEVEGKFEKIFQCSRENDKFKTRRVRQIRRLKNKEKNYNEL